jgi:uncharacterized protein YqgV (UPF0045/DUF77 family)
VVYAKVDFTVEPFTDGEMGPHVQAALAAARDSGYEPEVGPFGNSMSGPVDSVLPAAAAAVGAALHAGATGVAMTVTRLDSSDEAAAFLDAVRPVVAALGGRIVSAAQISATTLPLKWKGEVVAGVDLVAQPAQQSQPTQAAGFQNGLSALVGEVESTLGASLSDLDRALKQRAVRMLDERGAFLIRNAVEAVADTMGVSRVTVYNYLNATRANP